MTEHYGRRKTDGDFVIYASEKIGRLEHGYELAEKGFQTIMVQINALDSKVDGIKDALYGTGPDNIGIFERIRNLTIKISVILFILGAVGGFLGRYVEKLIFTDKPKVTLK